MGAKMPLTLVSGSLLQNANLLYNTYMKKIFLACFVALFLFVFGARFAQAQTRVPTRTPSPTLTIEEATASATLATPTPSPRPDITQKTEETIGPLEQLLKDQKLGSPLPFNFMKYAIRSAIAANVPVNTIVLLLMLPGVAALIAAARHMIGLRGFGIFLPAALSVSFVAIGPIVGIGLFVVIVVVSTFIRLIFRKFKIKLQYLPKMALMNHFIVMGVLLVLFMAPVLNRPDFANVSIFPVLFIILLAEDFNRVQAGKSAGVALNLAIETIILALGAFIFLNASAAQHFVLLHPESYIFGVAIFDFFVGKYVGLRFVEYWRFRKLISS